MEFAEIDSGFHQAVGKRGLYTITEHENHGLRPGGYFMVVRPGNQRLVRSFLSDKQKVLDRVVASCAQFDEEVDLDNAGQ